MTIASIFGLCIAAWGQQGQMNRLADDGSAGGIERAVSRYLDGKEIKNVLTPGEFSEWPMTLKEGQVVIAEARSDAFDPALEVVNPQGKVLASNDDRYPGDQRPLLLWRCTQAGDYAIHVRCFHDKSGGQFFMRLKTYDSVDLGPEKTVEQDVTHSDRFLLRIPMKAGQIKQVSLESPGGLEGVISPTGLPDINLAGPIGSVIPNTIMAPVDGDYYAIANAYRSDPTRVRAGTRTIPPASLTLQNGACTATGVTNTPALWTLPVKAGEILEATTSGLPLASRLVVAEEPDISKFDLKKPDANPFFPKTNDPGTDKGPALMGLAGRARDPRVSVFAVRRDATLWLATNSGGLANKEFNLTIQPAPKAFAEASQIDGKLGIGKTDYWAFDAKVGDVMTFNSQATNFAEHLALLDPDLAENWSAETAPDQTSTDWNMIVRKPGRYLVSVSCMGDGGAGPYSLIRKVFHAKEFGKGSPAKGDFSDGQVQVWKFTAKPQEPLIIHWSSSDWSYDISVRNENGDETGLPLTEVNGSNRYGILKVDRPTTFLIVMIPRGSKAKYSISLGDLPNQ